MGAPESPGAAPLVSVALATCNGARFLRTQLDSIYAQTVRDMEVIASDDASDDDTPAVLEEYAASHGLRVLRNRQRLGVKANFGNALRHCSGRYVALADQDDRWWPDKLARLLACLRASGATLVYSDARLVDAEGRPLGADLRERLELVYLRGRPRTAFYLHNCVTGCSVLFERSLLERALPIPDGALMHDWWLAWVATLENGIDFVDAPLLDYRQHGANQLGAAAPRRLRGLADAARLVLDVPGAFARLQRLQRWQARRGAHLEACATLERSLGLDTTLVDALVAWNGALRSSPWLGRYRELFETHPELSAVFPASSHRRLLRHRLVGLPALRALVCAQAVGLGLAAVAAVAVAVSALAGD